MPTQAELDRKRKLIMDYELAFSNQIGAAVIEKPKVNMWMILLPILFLHLIYRMKKYREGRLKFNEDFMITRRRAMDSAVRGVAEGAEPVIEGIVAEAALSEQLKVPYSEWVRVLADLYMDLLVAGGDDFESLVKSAYGNASSCLLAFNRLSSAERQFYAAIKPQMESTEGATDIIAAIQERSRQLRRELAERVFS